MTTSIAEVVLQLDQLSRHNQQLQDENAALRATISRIQDLHHIGIYWDWDGSGGPYTGCVHCRTAWPCPTITAIEPQKMRLVREPRHEKETTPMTSDECTCLVYVVDYSDPERYHPENTDRELNPQCPEHSSAISKEQTR